MSASSEAVAFAALEQRLEALEKKLLSPEGGGPAASPSLTERLAALQASLKAISDAHPDAERLWKEGRSLLISF